jgi:hypothetical protein
VPSKRGSNVMRAGQWVITDKGQSEDDNPVTNTLNGPELCQSFASLYVLLHKEEIHSKGVCLRLIVGKAPRRPASPLTAPIPSGLASGSRPEPGRLPNRSHPGQSISFLHSWTFQRIHQRSIDTCLAAALAIMPVSGGTVCAARLHSPDHDRRINT